MDGNRLQRLVNVDRLAKLENLSLRNQGGGKLYVDGLQCLNRRSIFDA